MKSIKPIPYYTSVDSRFHRALAADLRLCFRPAVARRLPAHHMAGQKQGFIPAFVAAHKKEYPYFVRTDIELFYPAVDPVQRVAPGTDLRRKA